MLKWVIIFIIGYCIYYIRVNKLVINWKTFFKKGFKKYDDRFGIMCYTAKSGRGKTFEAVRFLNKELTNDKMVICITNVISYYERNYNKFDKRIVYIEDFESIIDYINQHRGQSFIIFFDEIFSYLDKERISRKTRRFLGQLRKRGIILLTTAQEWREINMTFRKFVRFHIAPFMFSLPISHNAFIFTQINDGDLIHWDNDEQDFVAPRIQTIFSKCPLEVANSYDTYETI